MDGRLKNKCKADIARLRRPTAARSPTLHPISDGKSVPNPSVLNGLSHQEPLGSAAGVENFAEDFAGTVRRTD